VLGHLDATVLGRFAATLGIRALTGDDRVVTVPVGGSDRFEHVEQLDVFEGLLGQKIHSLELHDRDGRTDANREAIVAEAKRELYIFERDSIESYLLDPKVISRVRPSVACCLRTTTNLTTTDVARCSRSLLSQNYAVLQVRSHNIYNRAL
jgi:hypothetical protein